MVVPEIPDRYQQENLLEASGDGLNVSLNNTVIHNLAVYGDRSVFLVGQTNRVRIVSASGLEAENAGGTSTESTILRWLFLFFLVMLLRDLLVLILVMAAYHAN
ncbi:hypothetical protein BaRGS_00009400 [Batillaria attramentaria]|uniref:Uncharacterized protein n=1 Tax=Batillaria attramentaria TaxID=370345 RepID=A0ABD0LJ53_9CAEN